jgi:tetratricopeptide (TPR) repeat protein
MDDSKTSGSPDAGSTEKRLESWKEIAAYLKRDTRTVQRWERSEGLPVHRHFHSRQGTVYAFRAEIEAWWQSRRARLDPQSSETGSVRESGAVPESGVESKPPVGAVMARPAPEPLPEPLRAPGRNPAASRVTRIAAWTLAAAACLVVVALAVETPSGVRVVRDLTGWFRPARASSNPQPAKAQAQALYLEGRYYWNKRSAPDINTAIDYFTQAIVHDPGYAPAYVGLADCYNLLREYGTMPDQEAFPRALAAAKKAVEIDDTSSDAHTSLAFASFYGAWDSKTADREFSRAIELDPYNVKAHHWHATFLMTMGRSQEAIAEINRAQELDPASRSILADKGMVLFYAGHGDQALPLLRRLEQDDPSFTSPHRYIAFISLADGDYPGYLAESHETALLTKDKQALALVGAQEKGWARNGAKGMLEYTLRQQSESFEKGSLSAYTVAQTLGQLGEKRKALEYLQIAYRKHEANLLGIRIDPTLSALRNEPDYRELVGRVYPAN